MSVSATRLARAYVHAKQAVLASGFGWEIAWQRSRQSVPITEFIFLRESAWVILSAGMREAVIRLRFHAISHCFLEWRSAEEIDRAGEACVRAALYHFNHEPKLQAIRTVSAVIAGNGFKSLKAEIQRNPRTALQQFPYIGPVTWLHLAKNIGIAVAKPDRHLCRLAECCGYEDAQAFCTEISGFIGDPVDVVDIVLWRFATLNTGNYIAVFKGVAQS